MALRLSLPTMDLRASSPEVGGFLARMQDGRVPPRDQNEEPRLFRPRFFSIGPMYCWSPVPILAPPPPRFGCPQGLWPSHFEPPPQRRPTGMESSAATTSQAQGMAVRQDLRDRFRPVPSILRSSGRTLRRPLSLSQWRCAMGQLKVYRGTGSWRSRRHGWRRAHTHLLRSILRIPR